MVCSGLCGCVVVVWLYYGLEILDVLCGIFLLVGLCVMLVGLVDECELVGLVNVKIVCNFGLCVVWLLLVGFGFGVCYV